MNRQTIGKCLLVFSAGIILASMLISFLLDLKVYVGMSYTFAWLSGVAIFIVGFMLYVYKPRS